MNILDRYKKSTPKLFRILRNLGVSIATAAGTILAVPIPLPSRLLTIATYLLIIGTVVSAISQAVVEDDFPQKSKDQKNQNNQNNQNDQERVEQDDSENPAIQGKQKQIDDGY